ncbi:hypothetical protein STEG23_025691 [Scotinomys teguina]
MARKAGQGKEEEESRARQQEEKRPVREEEEKPACHGGAHHVVEQGFPIMLLMPQFLELGLVPDCGSLHLLPSTTGERLYNDS